MRRRSHRSYPLDRWATTLMVGLAVVMVVIALLADYAAARVRDFTWHDRKIGAEDIAFIITFSRPMDAASVEANLSITPPLSGKFSWAGRRMAYTLDAPAPYGELFQLRLDQAQDRFSVTSGQESRFEAFTSQFQTRHRAFAYIGTSGEEANRLVLQDLTQNSRQILTPKSLIVLDFEPYPLGDRILISAVDAATYEQGMLAPQLYTVTTGIPANPPRDYLAADHTPLSWWRRLFPEPPAEAGELTRVLDSQGYQNLKFDLSPDGKTIVVQRVNQENPADFGPWVIQEGTPRPLQTEPGGDFLIAPDSQSLLLLQGEGTAIIPLDETTEAETQPLDFLPEYGRVFDLKSDGTAAAMVNFNQDDPDQRYTESLVLVDNQGGETPLMQVSGTVIDAQFAPTNRILYTLTSEVLPGETYVEQPILSAINLETDTITDLLLLPPQQNLSMSLAPDGLALLLNLTTLQGGEADSAQQMWLLPLFNTTDDRLTEEPSQNSPEQLPMQGTMATWLP